MSLSKLPAKTARSDTVRKYIAHVLLTRYDATPKFATEIAGLWKVGRGRELCEARREQLENIFGTDFGLCIFRSVRDDEDDDWTQSYTAVFSNWMLRCSSLLVVGSLVMSFIQAKLRMHTHLTLFWYGLCMVNHAYLRPKGDRNMLSVGLFTVVTNSLFILLAVASTEQ